MVELIVLAVAVVASFLVARRTGRRRRLVFAVSLFFAFAALDLIYGVAGELDDEFNSLGAAVPRAVIVSLIGIAAWRWPRRVGYVVLVLAVPLGLLGAAFSGVGGLVLFGLVPIFAAVLLITGARTTLAQADSEPPPVSTPVG